MKQEPAGFLTELRQYLSSTPSGVKYWSFPVEEQPDRRTTPQNSITAEIGKLCFNFRKRSKAISRSTHSLDWGVSRCKRAREFREDIEREKSSL